MHFRQDVPATDLAIREPAPRLTELRSDDKAIGSHTGDLSSAVKPARQAIWRL